MKKNFSLCPKLLDKICLFFLFLRNFFIKLHFQQNTGRQTHYSHPQLVGLDVRVGLQTKLSAEELMLLNCGVEEDSWESLGLQGDQISQS